MGINNKKIKNYLIGESPCKIFFKKRFSIILFISILLVFPLIYALVGHPFLNIKLTIDESNYMPLLAIPIALAAYIATVRIALIARLKQYNVCEKDKKKHVKCLLLYLIPVDFNFIVSALGMLLIIFFSDYFCAESLNCIKSIVVICLACSVIYLAFLHLSAWVRTFNKALK